MKPLRSILFVLLLMLSTACAANNQAGTPVAVTPLTAAEATQTRPTSTLPPATVTALSPSTATPTSLPPTPRPTRTPFVWQTPTPTSGPMSTNDLTTAAPMTTTPTVAIGDSLVKVAVLAEALNLRAGPGTVYPSIGVVEQGTQLVVLGRNVQQDWFQVQLTDGSIAWVTALANYVQVEPPNPDLPIIPAPPLPSEQGTLLLQPQSGADFFLVDLNTQTVQRIAQGIDPAFSPDGQLIAFTRWQSGEVGTLWVYNLQSGTERPILGEMYEPKSVSWAPDGQSVVLSHQSGGRRAIEARCVDLKPGVRLPPGAYDINIGSETGRLCYKLDPDTHWKLRQVNITTGEYEDLLSARYSYAPTWNPAQPNLIVFFDAEVGLSSLDLGQNRHQLLLDDIQARAPVFGPAGRFLALSYWQHDHWEVYTIDGLTRQLNRLTRSQPLLGESFNSAAPAFSPDGGQIAFLSDRSGEWAFWLMNADGSNPRPLLSPAVAAQIGEIAYNGVDERLISWRPN